MNEELTNQAAEGAGSPIGKILIVGETGSPEVSNKSLADLEPAGSAQEVRNELWGHVGNEEIHTSASEREGWNGKADRAVGCKAGNLATLDNRGNPVDSGKTPEDFESVGSAQAVRAELTEALSNKMDIGPIQEISLSRITSVNLTSDGSYWQNQNGLVTLQGWIRTANQFVHNDILGILPEGFRPKTVIIVPVSLMINNRVVIQSAHIEISSSGNIQLFYPPSSSTANGVMLCCSFYSA